VKSNNYESTPSPNLHEYVYRLKKIDFLLKRAATGFYKRRNYVISRNGYIPAYTTVFRKNRVIRLRAFRYENEEIVTTTVVVFETGRPRSNCARNFKNVNPDGPRWYFGRSLLRVEPEAT